jgi:serine phosphatase RsbU (regulator of sigma subunit)
VIPLNQRENEDDTNRPASELVRVRSAEFQALGAVARAKSSSAAVFVPGLEEIQEVYEIRAVLEEIAGRGAARALKGKTSALRREVDAMRAAFRCRDLDCFVEHDVAFHRHILQASQNQTLVRVWDRLAVDERIRATIETVSRDFPDVVESHQPIVDALEKGRGREAGLLLRNHVETILEFLKKSESDSGFHRAIRDDLERAREVHKAFFPDKELSIPGLVCESFYKPVHSIGGDYYDFLPLKGDCWGIAIGDVCGKGIGAALLMASLQASLRAQAMHVHSDLSDLIDGVERLILAASPKHLYASLFYSEYDPVTRVLSYVNAGHNAPMVLRWKDNECKIFTLESTGLPLGILEGSQFTSQALQLETDDVLVMYTDGMTEAESPEGESWGQERLKIVLRDCRHCSPAQILTRIVDGVLTFTKGTAQSDDMTLVVVGVKHEAGI